MHVSFTATSALKSIFGFLFNVQGKHSRLYLLNYLCIYYKRARSARVVCHLGENFKDGEMDKWRGYWDRFWNNMGQGLGYEMGMVVKNINFITQEGLC